MMGGRGRGDRRLFMSSSVQVFFDAMRQFKSGGGERDRNEIGRHLSASNSAPPRILGAHVVEG